MNIKLLIELEYDEDIHGDDEDGIYWFKNSILTGTNGILLLHSNELGETIGSVNVLEIKQ